MAYEYFYQYYDQLMDDIPYDDYLDLVKAYLNKDQLALDLGCGTGNILHPLVRDGYSVDGLDVNEEMLTITQSKLTVDGLNSMLFNDDMQNLSQIEYYDVIFSLIDTINYLPDDEAIKRTFKGVYNALTVHGVFIFDIHNKDYIDVVFKDYSYHETSDELTYLWDTELVSEKNRTKIYHDLSFYIREKNSQYKRYDESHLQVVYKLKYYQTLLENSGFNEVSILYDFSKDIKINASKFQLICRK